MRKKAAVITGVAGGIGKSLASAFHKAGYFVIGLDQITTQVEGVDLFLEIDLNRYCEQEGYREKCSSELLESTYEIEVLINNAAVQLLDHIGSLKLEDWRSTMNVNVTAPMLLSKLFAKALTQNEGSIINICSIHNDQTKPRFVSYATSKSALVGLTKSLAVDFNGRVRVNAISPAAIDTEMLRAGFDNNEEVISRLKSIHPSGNIGSPVEVARLALFVANKESKFLNGANLRLDGISSVLKDLD
jgi:NAD(P)-dependent dehydrogenase (short-subunit alcohol dehydrogenase family)